MGNGNDFPLTVPKEYLPPAVFFFYTNILISHTINQFYSKSLHANIICTDVQQTTVNQTDAASYKTPVIPAMISPNKIILQYTQCK